MGACEGRDALLRRAPRARRRWVAADRRVPSVVSQSSSGAPTTSLGSRKLLPVKRRIVARSTRPMALDSDGKRCFQAAKPVLAVRTIDAWPYLAATTR